MSKGNGKPKLSVKNVAERTPVSRGARILQRALGGKGGYDFVVSGKGMTSLCRRHPAADGDRSILVVGNLGAGTTADYFEAALVSLPRPVWEYSVDGPREARNYIEAFTAVERACGGR